MSQLYRVLAAFGGEAAASIVRKQPAKEQLPILLFAGVFGTAMATEIGGRAAGALFLQTFVDRLKS